MDTKVDALHANDPATVRWFAYSRTTELVSELPANANIIIKPNITAPMPPSTGVTTHHEIVQGVLDALVEFDEVLIVESDATSSDFNDNIEGWGHGFLTSYHNARLVNLGGLPASKVILKGLIHSYPVELPDILLNDFCLINLPVMKTHILTGISLGIKNLFGLVPIKNKARYHPYIHDFIFALYRRFQPSLTILDGIVGQQGNGPIFGEPAHARIVFSGRSAAALDATAAISMGIDPRDILYLKNAILHSLPESFVDRLIEEHAVHIHRFRHVDTMVYQIINLLHSQGPMPVSSLLERLDLPEQTIRHMPRFLDWLKAYGIVTIDWEKITLIGPNLDRLFPLFPEVREIMEVKYRKAGVTRNFKTS